MFREAAMKMIKHSVITVALALALNAPAALPAFADGPDSVADLAEKLLPAVVNISTTQRVEANDQRRLPIPRAPDGSPFQEFFDEFFGDKNGKGGDDKNGSPNRSSRKVQSLGSGFVIDASGIIITNNHVIEGADEITANFADGTALIAELIGTDPKTDVAVLKVKSDKPLTAVSFGDSDTMRVGDWVMAIGNPFGLGGTVTVGIISAQNRDINSGPYDNFIQTDAAINRGNSGGPLFNAEGDVIGINTAIISPSGGSIGIGFAVPSNIAESVVVQLQEFGETRRGWLGVRIQQVTDDIAESLAMDDATGALVAGVTAGGPAEDGGIKPGDIILTFDGKEVETMRELPRIVADTTVGKKVAVIVLRDGEEVEVTVVLGRLEEGEKIVAAQDKANEEKQKDKPKPIEALGMTLADITDDLRTEYKIGEDVEGVVITSVTENSNAAEKQVRAGDVIQEISQETVTKAADAVTRIAELREDGRRSVLLLLMREGGELRFVAVRLEDE
ncbi:MAG: DegQ family serine endoprotease [Rhizobiales bacterium]|nr:DegQ family serine endoprotease [Hyphomicrobiales bacterium]